MVPPVPIGGSQTVSPGLLRSNSAILGSQGGSLPPQANFSSLVSPRTHCNTSFLGNAPNITSVFNQSHGNGGLNSGFHCGGIDTVAGPDPLSMGSSEIGFASSPSSFAPSNLSNPGSSDQVHNQQILNRSGNQLFSDKQQSLVRQLESQKYQHGQQQQQQQQQQLQQQHQLQQLQQQKQLQQQQLQYPSFQGGLGGLGPVKMEPQILSGQNGPQKHMQSLRNLSAVKLEQQQNQAGRGMGPVKLEPQDSDQPMLLQQQQRQQQFLQMSRQSSQTVVPQMNLLQQQRILHMQQQQQQQLLKALPQQRPQLQQHFQQQNLPGRSAARPVYEPGMCARRLTHYMYQQQHRPDDNNFEFWRTFVAEFFDPNAKKRWCVSLYGNSRQTNGVFPQDVWQCEICNHKPGRGFETTVAVLPRLYKIKYDSGTLEELLYVDMPHEYQNASGQIVLDYAKAVQESVLEQLRVVRDGQLRIVFSPELKICSWEFCARRHEELIPRRSIVPQVSHLGAAAQKYQATAHNASSNSSMQELQSNSNMFLASARQLAKALEVPLVNDLGYTKRYVRCLQISEVVNSMTDLIDYSRETGKGPMDCLAKFPRRTSSLSGQLNSSLQPEQQQVITAHNLISGNNSAQATSIQLSEGNGVVNVNNAHGSSSTVTAATTTVGLLRQNSTNSKHENLINNPNSPCTGTPVQIPSTGSSTTPPPNQPNPSSPFSSSTPSSSNNLPQTSHSALAVAGPSNHIDSANSPSNTPLHQSSQSNGMDPNESQSSVDRIIQEIMNSSQFGGTSNTVGVGAVGNTVKNMNGMTQTSQNSIGSGSCLVANGVVNNNSGNGHSGGGMDLSASAGGIRIAMGNKSATLTGRVGMPLMLQDNSMNNQHTELNNEILNDLAEINGFSNLQFDWKSSP